MYKSLIPNNTLYKSFNICDVDSMTGFRIGGKPPSEIKPTLVNENTRYLLTMPLDDTNEISIFHSFDFENDGESNPFDMWLNLFDDNCNLIQFIIHKPTMRGTSDELMSELTSHKIDIHDELPDGKYEEYHSYPYHKIGGIPYFYRTFDTNVYEVCNKLVKNGYFHLLQLAFPVGPNDGDIEGDWPFGECVFHVFMNMTTREIKYIWG